MARVVTFICREADREVRRFDARCGFVAVADKVITLASVEYDDLRTLNEGEWTHISWADASGSVMERELRHVRLQGPDLSCVLR